MTELPKPNDGNTGGKPNAERPQKFYQVEISPDLLSRGSGETIGRNEAVVYDFMPLILGSRFAVVPQLKRATHFFGGEGVPFSFSQQAYIQAAKEEIIDPEGSLTTALELYKRGLHAHTQFAYLFSRAGDLALLTQADLDSLHLGRDLVEIEEILIQRVAQADISVDTAKYRAWLKQVRELEMVFRGQDDGEDHTREFRDTYAKMKRYGDASRLSGYLAMMTTDPEEQEREKMKEKAYKRLAERIDPDPRENWRASSIAYRLNHEDEVRRGWASPDNY